MEALASLGILGPNLLFQIIHFLLLIWLLNALLYKPILKMFRERRERIREGLAEAERVREEAAAERAQLERQLAEERRASQDRLRDAVAKSEEAATQRLDGGQHRGRANRGARARRRGADAAAGAGGLHGEIADLALRLRRKALGEGLDDDRTAP